MTYANDVTGAYAALADLGNDADHVALALTERGICGERDDGTRCPVSNYLKELFPGSEPEVDAVVEFYGWKIGDGDWEETHLLAPPPVVDFIRAFDAGAFPDLVEGSNG